ncbi:WG repeat-containing protein [Chitinivorax sp. B]|uniref:WG repeat-containing protein n=1 Tax=Chitinivorax sp. B TaxID=2502235 RepID=UPI00148541A0|nr:WG repeat-containing protein [Chitinivorax sp. B]
MHIKKSIRNSITWVASVPLIFISLTIYADTECEPGAIESSSIEVLCPMKSGMSRIKVAGSWGFIDLSGKIVIAPAFDDADDFAEGLAAVQVGEKWGVIDTKGAWIVKPRFNTIQAFAEGLAAAEEGDKWGYIDRAGNWVIQPQYAGASSFSNKTAVVSKAYQQDLLIDPTGKILKQLPAHVDVYKYSRTQGLFSATVNAPPVLQNLTGQTRPVPADQSARFSGGLFITSKQETRNGQPITLYGTADIQGRTVFPPTFRSLDEFHQGLAIAAPDSPVEPDQSLQGLLSKNGKFVLNPAYQDIQYSDGWYLATPNRTNKRRDVIDQAGRIVLSVDCPSLTMAQIEQADSPWKLIHGCDQSWVWHSTTGLMKSLIKRPDIQVNTGYLLLLEEGESQDAQDKPFELFDNHGKKVLSSSDPTVKGQFDSIDLIQPISEIAKQKPDLLPVALLVKGYRQVAIFTHDHQVITRPEWQYESELLDYRFASADKPIDGPLLMKTEQGWGAINGKGEWVIQPDERKLSVFRNGLAFIDSPDGLKVIDQSGKLYAVPAHGRQMHFPTPYTLEWVDENQQSHRQNLKTGQTVAIPEGMTYKTFHQGLAPAEKDRQWGIINTQFQWLVQPRYNQIDPELHQDKLIGWKISADDKSGERTLYGWLNESGKLIVEPRYESIRYDANAKILMVRDQENGEGVLGMDGKVYIEPIYESVRYLDDGWFQVNPVSKQGLMNAQGEWVVQPRRYLNSFDQHPFEITKYRGELRLTDLNGRVSTAKNPLSPVEDGPAWWWVDIQASNSDSTGTLFRGFDFKERVTIPGGVAEHDRFSEGVVVFKPHNPTAKSNIGLADAKGKIIGLYPFGEIKPMQNGFAVVSQEVDHHSKTKKQGKIAALTAPVTRYGYLNRQGQLSIPLQFEAATNFSEARAVVINKGNLALIDTAGKVLLQGAWLCGKQPVLLNGQEQIIWPETAKQVQRCN